LAFEMYIQYRPVGSSPEYLGHSKYLYIMPEEWVTLPSFTLNMSRSEGEEMTFGGVIEVKK